MAETKQLITILIVLIFGSSVYIMNDQISQDFAPAEIKAMLEADNWYFCELENSFKQCSLLSSYSVADAKCVKLDGKGDICTKDGVRMAWKPFKDYLNVEVSSPHVQSLQECVVKQYNNTFMNPYNCGFELNGTEIFCYNETIIYYNETICVPIGFIVVYQSKNYSVNGDCCGFYAESPYKEFEGLPVISCKKRINNICNTLIQQSSVNPTVYDEYGMIYVILKDRVKPVMVGEYDYVLDENIIPSKLEVSS